MPKKEKVTLNDDSLLDVPVKVDEIATDARNTPDSPLPDDFFGDLAMTENPLDALSEDSVVAPDLAEEKTEPEKKPGPDDEVEGDKVKDDLEEDALEDTVGTERKGKSRNERWKEKLGRLEAELAAKDVKLERLEKHEPLVDMILEEARARKQTPASEEAQFKAPERPKRPTKPTNFSRERASEDPESADAKYLDARDEYQDAMDDYALDKEDYEFKVQELNTTKAQAQQQKVAQEEWFTGFQNGLAAEARKDVTLTEAQINEQVQQVMQVLSVPETYDPKILWRLGKGMLNAKDGVITEKPNKPPTKPAAKLNIPPVPSIATGNASIEDAPKGWIQGNDDEEVAAKFQEMLANL